MFPNPPTIAFRKAESIGNFLVHNDISKIDCIRSQENNTNTVACGRCKLCKNIMGGIPNVKALSRGTCKSRNVIYGAYCKKHDKVYVGQTSERLSDRFSKQRYDIKSRPENTELA